MLGRFVHWRRRWKRPRTNTWWSKKSGRPRRNSSKIRLPLWRRKSMSMTTSMLQKWPSLKTYSRLRPSTLMALKGRWPSNNVRVLMKPSSKLHFSMPIWTSPFVATLRRSGMRIWWASFLLEMVPPRLINQRLLAMSKWMTLLPPPSFYFSCNWTMFSFSFV